VTLQIKIGLKKSNLECFALKNGFGPRLLHNWLKLVKDTKNSNTYDKVM
jgi:hypothetical protein